MSSTAPDTRQRILQATLELLEESRGQGVRMSDIAKRARISRQALYLHFETRAKLMIATTFYLDELKGAQGRLLPSRTAKSGVERLDAYIEAWASYLPELHGAARAQVIAVVDQDLHLAAQHGRQLLDTVRIGHIKGEKGHAVHGPDRFQRGGSLPRLPMANENFPGAGGLEGPRQSQAQLCLAVDDQDPAILGIHAQFAQLHIILLVGPRLFGPGIHYRMSAAIQVQG